METTERIENYLSGTLNEAEKQAFENELSQNADLAEALALHKNIHAFLLEKEVGNLKNEVKNWLAAEEKTTEMPFKVIKNTSRNSRFYFTRIAAVLAIFAGIFWWISQKQSFSADKYLSEIKQETPAQLQGNDEKRSQWTIDFREKNFEKVIQLLQNSENAEENYFLGIAQMLKKSPDYATAVKQFSLKNVQKSSWHEKADWLKAICFFRNNQKNEAKKMLEMIAKSDSEFKEKANEWLKNW